MNNLNNQTGELKDDAPLSLNDVIFIEKVDALYKSLLASALANIVIALTLVLMLWQVIDHTILIVWLMAMTGINLVRLVSYFLYKKTKGIDFE